MYGDDAEFDERGTIIVVRRGTFYRCLDTENREDNVTTRTVCIANKRKIFTDIFRLIRRRVYCAWKSVFFFRFPSPRFSRGERETSRPWQNCSDCIFVHGRDCGVARGSGRNPKNFCGVARAYHSPKNPRIESNRKRFENMTLII